jgi:hypothetical protein
VVVEHLRGNKHTLLLERILGLHRLESLRFPLSLLVVVEALRRVLITAAVVVNCGTKTISQ